MISLLRQWIWIFGLFFIVVAGLLFLSKVRKHQDIVSNSNDESSHDASNKLSVIKSDSVESEFSTMLQALFVRTGLNAKDARDQLVRWDIIGDTPSSAEQHALAPDKRTGLFQLSRQETQKELEQAIRAGLNIARSIDDDYSQAGIEYESATIDPIEVDLLDENSKQQLTLYSKLLHNLQEMCREDEFPTMKDPMEEIIARLQDKTTEIRKGLTHKTVLEDAEFGTSEDRRFYYFQLGVVQYLRSRNVIPELKDLYRPGTAESAVDYNIQEVYSFLKQNNDVLITVERLGISHLLKASDEEIEAIVEKALPENLS